MQQTYAKSCSLLSIGVTHESIETIGSCVGDPAKGSSKSQIVSLSNIKFLQTAPRTTEKCLFN